MPQPVVYTAVIRKIIEEFDEVQECLAKYTMDGKEWIESLQALPPALFNAL